MVSFIADAVAPLCAGEYLLWRSDVVYHSACRPVESADDCDVVSSERSQRRSVDLRLLVSILDDTADDGTADAGCTDSGVVGDGGAF